MRPFFPTNQLMELQAALVLSSGESACCLMEDGRTYLVVKAYTDERYDLCLIEEMHKVIYRSSVIADKECLLAETMQTLETIYNVQPSCRIWLPTEMLQAVLSRHFDIPLPLPSVQGRSPHQPLDMQTQSRFESTLTPGMRVMGRICLHGRFGQVPCEVQEVSATDVALHALTPIIHTRSGKLLGSLAFGPADPLCFPLSTNQAWSGDHGVFPLTAQEQQHLSALQLHHAFEEALLPGMVVLARWKDEEERPLEARACIRVLTHFWVKVTFLESPTDRDRQVSLLLRPGDEALPDAFPRAMLLGVWNQSYGIFPFPEAKYSPSLEA